MHTFEPHPLAWNVASGHSSCSCVDLGFWLLTQWLQTKGIREKEDLKWCDYLRNISGSKAWVRSSIDSYSTDKLANRACYHCHLRTGKPKLKDVGKSAWECLGRI